MSMTKKQIIETLKAMELEYNPASTKEELQSQLDDALGTSKKAVTLKKQETSDEKVQKDETKVQQKQEPQKQVKGRTPSFEEIMAYQAKKRNEALGR